MAHKIVIYLPSQWEGEPIPCNIREKETKNCLLFITNLCGGASEVDGVGIYKNSTKIEIEPITIVYGFSRENFQEKIPEVAKFCHDLRTNLQQDALAYEVDGTLYLV